MTSALTHAVESGDLAAVQAAAPGASPEELDLALFMAIADQAPALFDFLLPLALASDPRGDALQRAVVDAASRGSLHALGVLLPPATALPSVLIVAISHRHDAATLAIIAELSARPDELSGHLPLAVSHSSTEVVRALIPLSTTFDLENAIFIAASLRQDMLAELAAPLEDVAPVIERILAPRLRRSDGEFSATTIRSAGMLLAFLPMEQRLEIIAQHPDVRDQPIAVATLQQAALESGVAPAPARPVPRI